MPKASDIKKNAAIEHNGKVLIVRDITRSVPQGRAGGSLYRMRLYDVVTGGKVDETFKAEDMLNRVCRLFLGVVCASCPPRNP